MSAASSLHLLLAGFDPCDGTEDGFERSKHLLFETIIEEAFSEVYVFDAATLQLVLANKSARRNLDYGKDEIRSLTVADIKPDFSTARLHEIYRPLIEDDVPRLVVHTCHKRKNGSRYPVEVHSQKSTLNGRAVIFQIVLDQTEKAKLDLRADVLAFLEEFASTSRSADAFLLGVLEKLCVEWSWPVGHIHVWRQEPPGMRSSGLWHFKDRSPWQADCRPAAASALGPELADQVYGQRRPVLAPDSSFEGGASWPSGIRVGFGIPVFCNNEVAAVIELFSPLPRLEIETGFDEVVAMHISRLYERKRAEEQLTETNERLDAAMRGANVGFWDYNYRTGKYFLSPRCREILHLDDASTPADWRSFGSKIHPDDIEAVRVAMRAHKHERKPYDVRYRYQTSQGEYIWLRIRAQGVWNEDGDIIRTAGVVYDLPLEMESEFFRRDLMPAMAAGADTHEKISETLTIARRYLKAMTGIVGRVAGDEYDVLYGDSPIDSVRPGARLALGDMICSDVYPADDVVCFEDLADSPLADHKGRLLLAVGSYIGAPIFVRGVRYGVICFWSPTPREARFSQAMIAVVRLLAQWVGEEIGRASELADLLENDVRKTANLAAVGDALLTLDDAGRVEDANAAASSLFGAGDGELRGVHFSKLLPAAHAIVDPSGSPTLVKDRQEVAVRSDGQRIAILVSISEIRLADRRLFTAALTDLTAVKQAETAKREFVSVVSHELRTPLTSIRGALGVIASQRLGPLNPATENLIKIAQRNSERLARLVDDILDIEKLETGKLELTLRPLSLAEALEEALSANAAYAARFNVSFELSVEPDLPEVVADSDRLLQVLANLLSNAAKFTRPHTIVRVDAKKHGKWAKVSVQDQGEGISLDRQGHLFEKFSQGDHSNTRQREGSGLGLSITKQLLKLMNGDVGFVSTPGEGTIFYFRLPLARETTFAMLSAERPSVSEPQAVEISHVV